MPTPPLSVIVPSRERVDLLTHCLRAVTTHAPGGTEVVVVDDASDDARVSGCAAGFPGVRVVRLDAPAGFCVAANAGLRAATSPWVQLLNDDAEPTAGWAEPALTALALPGVAAVAPLVLLGAPGTEPARIDSAGDTYTLGGVARKRHHGERLDGVALPAGPVFGASGAAAFYRRDVVLGLGGFHEPFGAYFEDVDLAFRLHWAGWGVRFEPASVVWHRGGASHGPPQGALLEQQSRNEELVFWRNMPAGLLWRALPRHLAVLAGKALRRLREGTFLAFLRGRLRAWASLPTVAQHRRALHARVGDPERWAVLSCGSLVADATPVPLWTLARVFLWLGATSFGGPAAHIALMEEEFVRRRGWLTRDELLDLIGAANLIPGPNSTEVAIHVGHRLAGWPGLVVAGACFIVPAVLIVLALAWATVTFGSLPPVKGIFAGVAPVVVAVVLQALVKLGGTSVKSGPLGVLAAVAVVLAAVGVHELLILFAAGFLMAALPSGPEKPGSPALLLATLAPPLAAAPPMVPFGLWPLFLFFLKVGSVLFGSGYVLLAFLRADLVERYGWLTEQQLLDAVAIGQVTPGPVFTTATFIGYLLSAREGLPGVVGGLVATVGIFLPAFVFVALSVPLLPRLRRSPRTAGFLDGVNVASLALMAVATFYLGRAIATDVPSVVLAVVSAVLLLAARVSATWLLLAGAALGLARALAFGP